MTLLKSLSRTPYQKGNTLFLLGKFSDVSFYFVKLSTSIRKYNHQHMHTILAFSDNVYLFVSRNTNVGIKIRI